MWCAKCKQHLSKCECPDLKERLKRLSESPYIATKWCTKCDNHYNLCQCEEPDWTIKTGN